jgi:DNA-binding MarR family transcriptional regulator
MLVLRAVASQPGASNRQIGRDAGIQDQGQMSKLLARLERLGLIVNGSDGTTRGAPNAWKLTPSGVQIERATNRPRAPEG